MESLLVVQRLQDLFFIADDSVFFPESLKLLIIAPGALHEKAKPLGIKISWVKTKAQVLGSLLEVTVQCLHACGEDIEISENLTYLGSVVRNDGGSNQEVIRQIGSAQCVIDLLSTSIWRCRSLCRWTKIRIFK